LLQEEYGWHSTVRRRAGRERSGVPIQLDGSTRSAAQLSDEHGDVDVLTVEERKSVGAFVCEVVEKVKAGRKGKEGIEMKGDDDVFSPGGESIIPPLHTYTWYIQTYISEHPSTLLIPFGHGKTARDRSTVALPVCCLPFDHANPFSPYPPFGVERPRGLSVDPHFITVHTLIAKSFLIIARPSDTNTRKDTHAPRSPRHYFMQVIPVRRPPCQAPTQSILGLARLHRPPQAQAQAQDRNTAWRRVMLPRNNLNPLPPNSSGTRPLHLCRRLSRVLIA
jgi:hypothetical protein